MKNRKILFGIVALVCAAMVVLAGCGGGDDYSLPIGWYIPASPVSPASPAIPATASKPAAVSYISRDSSGTTYYLRIISQGTASTSIASGSGALFSVRQSAGAIRAAVAAQAGDEYELTIIKSDGSKQISTGTVASSAGGSLSLQPRTAGAPPFTVSVSSGNMSKIDGSITLTEGSYAGQTVAAPGGELTVLVPEVDQVLYDLNGNQVTGDYDVFFRYEDNANKFEATTDTAGTFTDGKFTLALPKKLDESKLQTLAEYFSPDSCTAPGISADSAPGNVRFLMVNVMMQGPRSGSASNVFFGKSSTVTFPRETQCIQYMYFAKAVTIDTEITYPGVSSSCRFKGNFTAGWNKVYTEVTENDNKNGYFTLMSMELNKVPAGMQWTWDNYPSD